MNRRLGTRDAYAERLREAGIDATPHDTLPDALRLLLTLAPGQAINGTLTLDWVRPDFGGGSP